MNIASIKIWLGAAFGCTASIFSSLFGIHTNLMGILLFFMAADYLTGLIVAGVYNKSNKSESGAIRSGASLKGLFQKGGMLLVVYISLKLDFLLHTEYVAYASIYFFIVNELVSLVENLGIMGVPWPDAVISAIEVLKMKKK